MYEPYDTIFSLPSVEDDPDTEIGVLLMGLGPERLLAGLGVASRNLAQDPATVTLYVDQLRHGARHDLTFDDALASGAGRWLATGAATAPPGKGSRSASLRQQWSAAEREITANTPELRTFSAAEQVYLVACWLRREEITRLTENHVVLPELPS